MKDTVVKLTIKADSAKEAEKIAKADKKTKAILKTEPTKSIWDVTVVQSEKPS